MLTVVVAFGEGAICFLPGGGSPVETSAGFTREGQFYWLGRSRMLGYVKWIYIILLGLLLIAFLAGKPVDDLGNNNNLFGVIDLLIAAPTLLFFLAYAKSSVSFDKPEERLKRKGKPNT